jgi:hypothetical protein
MDLSIKSFRYNASLEQQAQQILQTAASTSLPSLLTADVPQRAPTPTSSITSPMSPWYRRTA